MTLGDRERAFIDANPGAAMITLGDDGVPKAVRVAVGLIDGRLWSSRTRDRVRTRRLQRDPRCTLYVHEAGYGFLVLETTVTVLDGPDVADDSVRFFRLMQHQPDGPLRWFGGELEEAEFRQTMLDEGRLLYEFEPHRVYGLY